MKYKILVCVFLFCFLVQTISAYTQLNIYIDEKGEAIFLGETDEQLVLPSGVEIQEGIIKGATQTLTNKSGEVWEFVYSLQGAEIYVILPKDAGIKTLNEGEITLEGDRLAIYVQENVQVEYVLNEHSSSNAWIFLLVVLVVVAGIIYYFLRNKSKKTNNTNGIEHMLNKREKLILDKLSETGKIKSSQLRKICEIPKASFSRHVQELEKKKLIKRSGEGKNRFVEKN